MTDVSLRTKRGFLSSATNCFQFGILEELQWCGEERLLKNTNEPIGYSIVAKNKVRAFAISRDDAQKKFTIEITNYIKSVAEQRYKWVLDRAKHLVKASVKVANMDPSEIKYDDNLTEHAKKYPIATTYVLTNIRKKNILEALMKKSGQSKKVTVATRNPQILSLVIAKNEAIKVLPQISSSICSPRNSFVFFKTGDSGVFSPRRSSRMGLASSAPKIAFRNVFTPVYSITQETHRDVRHRRSSSMEDKKVIDGIFEELKSKAMNKFGIGRKTICMVDNVWGGRPKTPNPFGRLGNAAK
jgi:hypothetical protein